MNIVQKLTVHYELFLFWTHQQRYFIQMNVRSVRVQNATKLICSAVAMSE
jgi:hypothetical protein